MRRALTALALFAVLGSGADADTSGWWPRRPIDLLSVIDLKQDSVRGAWILDNGVLTCIRKETSARVVIPYIPPEEFDLVIVAERSESSDALTVGLVSGNQQFVHCVDGYTGENKVLSGFEILDQKVARDNESRRDGQVFTNGKHSTLLYRIRKGHIRFAVDGNIILDWKGDFNRLAIRPDYRVGNPRVLSIGAWMSHFRISRMTLYPLSDGGRLLRENAK